MTSIDELIKALCLDGIRYVALRDVARTIPGLGGKRKEDFSDGNARFVSYKNVYANPAVDQEAMDFVVVADGERQNRLHDGDVLFTGSSENVEDVGMSAAVVGEPAEPLYLNSFCFAVRFDHRELLPEFSKHLFRSEFVRAQIRKTASGVTRINVSKERFMRTRVPVPPPDVQRAIVRALDAFGALERELTAELQARQTQRLAALPLISQAKRVRELSPDGLQRVRLGEVAKKYVKPVRVQPGEVYTNLGVKWYGEGAFAREPKLGSDIKAKTLYRVKPGQFIYNRMFVTEGSFGLVTADLGDGVVSNEFPAYDLDASRVVPEWLYLRFQDPRIVASVAAETTGGTKSRRRWKEEQFEAFELDLPTVAAQREIVRMSTALGALVTSLKDEITLRRAQYAHYRDRLLTFRELS